MCEYALSYNFKVSSKTNISTPPVILSSDIASAVAGSLNILMNNSLKSGNVVFTSEKKWFSDDSEDAM